jgi:hypothetical protein
MFGRRLFRWSPRRPRTPRSGRHQPTLIRRAGEAISRSMRSPLARERCPPRCPSTVPDARLFSRLTLPSWSVSGTPRASAAAFLFIECIATWRPPPLYRLAPLPWPRFCRGPCPSPTFTRTESDRQHVVTRFVGSNLRYECRVIGTVVQGSAPVPISRPVTKGGTGKGMTLLIFLTERTCDIGLATRTCDTDLRHGLATLATLATRRL